MTVRYFRRCLESEYERYEADGWSNPVAHYIPSLKEAILVVERKTIPILVPDGASPTVRRAVAWLQDIADLLIAKNASYGDSAANPIRIFSRSSSTEQLLVRIDDKLSRIARGDGLLAKDEDVLRDLVGYLALLAASQKQE